MYLVIFIGVSGAGWVSQTYHKSVLNQLRGCKTGIGRVNNSEIVTYLATGGQFDTYCKAAVVGLAFNGRNPVTINYFLRAFNDWLPSSGQL